MPVGYNVVVLIKVNIALVKKDLGIGVLFEIASF